MPRTGDFSETTKGELAHRVGYRCSYPGCNAVTAGPSRESANSTANTGTACHIYAASDGPSARRVSPSLSPVQLRQFENGIWMCRTHGKLIDDDECTYSPDLLKHWRHLAERKAELRQQYGIDVDFLTLPDSGLDPAKVAVEVDDLDDVQRRLYEAFFTSCLADSWGAELASQTRELVTELCQNALTHGGASLFSMSITPFSITLQDDGSRFGINDLTSHEKGRGGATAARQIIGRFDQVLIASSIWDKDRNVHVLALVRSPGDVTRVTPCSIEIGRGDPNSNTNKLIEFCRTHPECQRIYVVKPFGTNYSELYLLVEQVVPLLAEGQDIVLVVPGSSIALRTLAEQISRAVKLLDVSRTQ